MPEVNLDQRSEPKFDYCETNLNRFSETIKWLEHEYSECNFNQFTDYIKQEINEPFLVDENDSKKSKRTILFNPWITPAIIVSVNKKHFHYNQWKKTVTKKEQLGDFELYSIYKKIVKML